MDLPYNMFPRPAPEQDFMLYPDSSPQTGYPSPVLDMGMSPESFGFPRGANDDLPQPPVYDMNAAYAEGSNFMYNGRTSPAMFPDDGEMRIPPSNLSTVSVGSAPSSTVGSPNSNHGQLAYMPEYQRSGFGVVPGIVGSGEYFTGTEYSTFPAPGMEEFTMAFETKPSYVDPSLIHPEIRGQMPPPRSAAYENASAYSPQNPYPNSPSLSGAPSPAPVMRNGSQSPYMHGYQTQYSPFAVPPPARRRPSLSSYQSPASHEYSYNSDESEKKQRCADCGKPFKDLKAHMLTHQNERPEKCPITTCEYHIKGFARKYDKNRHTLTHYKGTMVCGFCPGSGSAAEKSFNRADVFKRHLTAVHGVEQTPPNSRKKPSAAGNTNNNKELTGYAPDATGKCSTCSATFSNAQDFYEHLDDCVLRTVQQEDPGEVINARRLAEVENDSEVYQTLEKNQLPLTTPSTSNMDDDEDDEMAEEVDNRDELRKLVSPVRKRTGNPPNGVQKSRGMTHSRGGVSVPSKSKGRKNRREYPASWGFDKGQMTMKKRVLTVYDGPRRLAKDDMMLSTEHEVRVKLSDGKSYVTDLDVQTLKRADGFHSATPQERGIWVSNDPTEEEVQQMLAMSQQ
ncbi:hypothetical protein GGR56DRAFT_108254 [Xylariaceae sp. FL0804]|nr:hypothetical protein GGR56DRAFT_108254 [Xylariaceae sp. FL0804]